MCAIVRRSWAARPGAERPTWAAGPRIAQYIGPQLGQIAAGIGASARDQGADTTVERHDFIAHTWAKGAPDAGIL